MFAFFEVQRKANMRVISHQAFVVAVVDGQNEMLL